MRRGAVSIRAADVAAGGGHAGVAVAVEPAVSARRAQADAHHAQEGLPARATRAAGEKDAHSHGETGIEIAEMLAALVFCMEVTYASVFLLKSL